MATRQNKKRKGRNNAPPRERTVTTLTDGPDGPFMSSSADELASPNLISAPYVVSSSLPPAPQPPGISSGPFSLQAFPSPFPYSFSHMSNLGPALGGSFQQQHSPPQFYTPQAMPPTPLATSQQQTVLPPGQNDLEILERLKETIKSNRHELFRPIPQPAALASVYLGPRSSATSSSGNVSHVPPHPEQIPTNTPPPGLSLDVHNAPSKLPAVPSAQTDSTSGPQASDPRDGPRMSVHRSSVSESPKTNNLPAPVAAKRLDRYDSAASLSGLPGGKEDKPASDPATSARYGNAEASTGMGPPGLSRSEQSGHQGEITHSPQSLPAKLSPVDSKDDLRSRELSWSARNGLDDRDRAGGPPASRPDPRNGSTVGAGTSDKVGPIARDPRPLERDRDRSLRDRDYSRDRDYDRDRDRDRLRDVRPRDDRRVDDRRLDDRYRPEDRGTNTASAERRYGYPPRRYDSKEGSSNSGRLADSRPPPRNLGEERAIVRPHLEPSASRPTVPEDHRTTAVADVDDRNTRPPPSVDDRRPPVPPSGSERPSRPVDDRRVPPTSAPVDRGRLDDRRLPPPTSDRPGTGSDERRRAASPPASDRAPRPIDDRRAPIPPRPALSYEQARPSEESRAAALPAVKASTVAEDRRPQPLPVVSERPARPAEDRRPTVLEERISRAPAPPSLDPVPPRPSVEDRSSRPAPTEDRSARPVPLEERISRLPSLQERLSYPPPRPEEKPASRLEERLGRPSNSQPSLEERLSNPPTVDSRPPRPPPDDRPPRPATLDRPAVRPSDDRSVLAEPARGPAPASHAEDRHYSAAARFTRPASPAVSDRGHPPRTYRASSVIRDEPRSFRPPSPGRPPSRADVREFRPASDLRDRVESRPYRPESERYPVEPRSEVMDVDAPPRFSDRASYRRASPPSADYPPRTGDRAWVPAGETPPYRDSEPARRTTADSHSYNHKWREGERPYGEDWNDRSWDRSREYDRDSRFSEREPAWETREERERRSTYPPPAQAPPADLPPTSTSRTFEPRPLSSRISDSYPDDRGFARDLDRGRYPPVDPAPPPASYSRVRPRSPSPVRRSSANDDLRPPPKRARDDAYPGGSYYPPSDEPRGPSEYPPPRLRTPPPAGGRYYDDPRYNASSSTARDREYLDSRDRDGGYAYDRRGDGSARMPPPPSPPSYNRAVYGRDERRYSVPPR